LTAVVGECQRPPEPAPDTLLRYERVMEDLMGEGTVLPARFGTAVPDDAAVVQLLGDRHDELHEALVRVAGAVELGVRARWSDDTGALSRPSGPSAGSRYMFARLQLRRRARELASHLDAVLGELARARRSRLLPAEGTPVAAAYLVDRGHAEEFVHRSRRLDESIDDASLVCTGPWPPYSFVTGESA
jgi:hypothetical protein